MTHPKFVDASSSMHAGGLGMAEDERHHGPIGDEVKVTVITEGKGFSRGTRPSTT